MITLPILTFINITAKSDKYVVYPLHINTLYTRYRTIKTYLDKKHC